MRRPEGGFQKGEEFLHVVAELQARQLKRTGKVVHVLVGGGSADTPPCGELCGLGLREIAAIAAHDNSLLPPAREWIQRFTIIDRSGGQIKAAGPSRLITLHVEFEAIPPAQVGLRFVRSLTEGAVLARPRHVTHRQRRRVLLHDGIVPPRLPIAMAPQRV